MTSLPIGRSSALAAVFEEVISEVEWKIVILQQLLPLRMLQNLFINVNYLNEDTYVSVTAVEDVEGTVVVRGLHVIHVILHFQFDAVALVILIKLLDPLLLTFRIILLLRI